VAPPNPPLGLSADINLLPVCAIISGLLLVQVDREHAPTLLVQHFLTAGTAAAGLVIPAPPTSQGTRSALTKSIWNHEQILMV
jgi:hypothetical protein